MRGGFGDGKLLYDIDDALSRFAMNMGGKQNYLDQMQDELETQSFRDHKNNYSDMSTMNVVALCLTCRIPI